MINHRFVNPPPTPDNLTPEQLVLKQEYDKAYLPWIEAVRDGKLVSDRNHVKELEAEARKKGLAYYKSIGAQL